MEHPCHKCGAGVEDGVPFCKHCGAPQIRVAGVEAPVVAPPAPTDSAANLPIQLPSLPAIPRTGIHWGHALPSAALAGAFSVLAAQIPLAAFGPAFLAGGALAVVLYRRHVKDRLLSPGEGAQIGAASGGFGFLFVATFVVAMLVYRPEELRQPMLKAITHPVVHYDSQKIEQMQALLKTSEGLTFVVVFGLFLLILVSVVGSSIGGALYAAWLRKRMTL